MPHLMIRRCRPVQLSQMLPRFANLAGMSMTMHLLPSGPLIALPKRGAALSIRNLQFIQYSPRIPQCLTQTLSTLRIPYWAVTMQNGLILMTNWQRWSDMAPGPSFVDTDRRLHVKNPCSNQERYPQSDPLRRCVGEGKLQGSVPIVATVLNRNCTS
jgi:hypothetical protein